MNFANVKNINISEGVVKKISINGVDVWEKSEPVPSGPWEALYASINRGTYRTDYAIGDLIPMDLGTEGNINMQIVGFDCDPLSAGGNYAAVSLISKELLNTSHRINPVLSGSAGNYDVGTGGIGGWGYSEIRDYLKNTIKPLIPANVISEIVEVVKTQYACKTNGVSELQTTYDDVWIPGRENEITGTSSLYYELFKDNTSRIKSKIGQAAEKWWTRRVVNTSGFYYVYATGAANGSGSVDTSYGISLGFCIGVGAPMPSATMLLNTITRPTAYSPILDDDEDIPDEQALDIITGGER